MALTAAAGPISNILLSLIFAAILRLDLLLIENVFGTDISIFAMEYWSNFAYDFGEISFGFKITAVLTYMLYMGVLLNVSLAIFNLIPIPPFDGSRIAYTFLPINLYFKIMQYERYIMIGILALLWFTPVFDDLINTATTSLSSLIMAPFNAFGESYTKIYTYTYTGVSVKTLDYTLGYVVHSLIP